MELAAIVGDCHLLCVQTEQSKKYDLLDVEIGRTDIMDNRGIGQILVEY